MTPLRICMTEPVEPESRGSMGCHYVMETAKAAGYDIEYVDWDSPTARCDYDVELISVHHCTDFPRLAQMPRRGKIRLAGGHPSTNNWRPAIKYADAHCIGDGEPWIVPALDILSSGGCVDDLKKLPGTIITSQWDKGEIIPQANAVSEVPKHPPYLNFGGEGHARVWYIELSRGCPFKCHYCELGWSRMRAKHQDTDWIVDQIKRIDKKKSNKISLFAPDEASHPGYGKILQAIHDSKLVTSFGSMRIDQILKANLPIKANMLVRVGLDGLTEETRIRVKKVIRTPSVIDYFRFMSENGHSNFKIFMVFGYPWETLKDFDEFEYMMEAVRSIPRRVAAHVRVKFTPFIPQPSTPLKDSPLNYDHEMVKRINGWFDRMKRTSRSKWFIHSDGIMSEKSHKLQWMLTHGDEDLMDRVRDWNGTETLKGYDVFDLLEKERKMMTIS
jgi:radical SAM superfamily enzyme YgiQ (UPF0313 family)